MLWLLLASLLATQVAPVPTPTPAEVRRTVGIAPFTAASPREQWIAEGFSHALSGRFYELSDTNALTVRQVAAAMRSSGIDKLEGAQARNIARELGADTLVAGSLASTGRTLELTLVLIDREETIEPIRLTITGERASPVALERAAAVKLAEALHIKNTDAFVARVVTANDAAWLALFQAVQLLGTQSLSPRSADASVPPALTTKERTAIRQLVAESLAADPTLGPAFACRAVVDALDGDFAAAADAIGKSRGGQGPLTTLVEVFVAMRKGEFDGALEVLQAAIKERPGFLHARGTLGQLYAHVGRFREARATFESYIAVAPKQPWAHAQLGYALSRLKKYDESVEVTQKALALAPESPELLVELAGRLIDAGRYPEAADPLSRAQKYRPKDPRIYVRLGYVHLMRDEAEAAIKVSEAVLRYADVAADRKELAYAHLNMTRAWARLGQFDVALEQLGMARDAGLRDCGEIEADERLAKFRADPRYKRAKF